MKVISFDRLFYKIKILLTVFLVCFMGSSFFVTNVAAQNEIVWESDFEQAVIRAKTLNRPLFLHFYGDNCPPCKLMESNVFTDGQVVGTMNRFFVALKIKVSEQPQLAKKYAIQVIPTDLVLAPDGQLIHRRQGGIATERFVEYLRFLLSSVHKEAVQSIPTPTLNRQQTPESPHLVSQSTFQSSTPQTVPSQQPAMPNVASIPKAEQIDQPLRDPFTKQPVVSPQPVSVQTVPVLTVPVQTVSAQQPIPVQTAPALTVAAQTVAVNQTPSERANPVRVTENRPEEEKGILPKTTETAFVVPTHKEPIVVPSVSSASSVGFSGNPDEMTTTMVEVPLGLEGYCPVLLSTEERWIPGNPAYYTMYRGHVFRFSSEEAMAEFMKSPAHYAPVAMGEDIVQMVDRNKKVYGNRKFGAWFQGRVFLFSSQDSLDAFAARPEYYTEIALKYETAFKGNFGRF
ncbi:MAG: DUF255 domain-containing protein [Planctomycetaceae bacterium]|jgi:YHS domain-containing protein/thioredoxin-related protein|nr:DUF255 domain-containing protein [Planctomycetaceae bacterium]